MPSVLRSRLALFAILGVFLIPIVTTNLRGLTHVLTCSDDAETPFTLALGEDGGFTGTSSAVIERPDPDVEPTTDTTEVDGDEEPAESIGTKDLCGGLSMEMAASDLEGDDVTLTVRIQNGTEDDWYGSVSLQLGSVVVPVGIGRIDSGEIGSDEVKINLDPGESREVEGKLLIGP